MMVVDGRGRGRSLLPEIEKAFSSTGSKPVLAFKVVKCLPAVGSRKHLPKPSGRPRVASLAVEDRGQRKGQRSALLLLKETRGGSHWEIGKSYRLQLLTRVELYKAPPSGPQYVEMTFQSTGYVKSSDVRLNLEFVCLEDAHAFLAELHNLMMSYEKQVPVVVGINLSQLLPQTTGSGTLDVLSQEAEIAEEMGGLSVKLSEAEEQALRTLLAQFTGGGGVGSVNGGGGGGSEAVAAAAAAAGGSMDVLEFEANLQEEADGLERANVHAIMSSIELGQQIGQQLQSAINSLDDLDQSLQVFDVKLRHMREDIGAIEGRNNRLEVVSRNDARLLHAVEDLLAKLDLPERTAVILKHGQLTRDTMPEVVDAAWDLHARMSLPQERGAATASGKSAGSGKDAPSPSSSHGEGGGGRGGAGGQSQWLSGMTAVREQQAHLTEYSGRFNERAQAFVSAQLDLIAAQTVKAVNVAGAKGRMQMPDHGNMHNRFLELIPLLEVMAALDPGSLAPICAKYALSMNKLLKKELRMYVQLLERSVLGNQRKQGDVDASQFTDTQVQPARAGAFVGDGAAELDWTFQMGEAVGLMSAHRAYKLFLDSFMPFLEDEAGFAADFLQLWASGPSFSSSGLGGSRASSAVLHGASSGNLSAKGAEGGSVSGHGNGGGGGGVLSSARRLTLEGGRTIDRLLDGISPAFLDMASVSKRAGQPLSVIPMLDSTLAWGDRLRASDSSWCTQPLASALDAAKALLVDEFKGRVEWWTKQVEATHYHHRLQGSKTVKGMHVLPVMDEFLQDVHDMEDLLSESQMINSTSRAGLAARPGVQGGSSGKNLNRAPEVGDKMNQAREAGEQALGGGRGSGLEMDFEDDDSYDEWDPTMEGGAGVAAPEMVTAASFPPVVSISDARQVVDVVYNLVLRHLFDGVERVAAADAKHGCRLRMENYLACEGELHRHISTAHILALYYNKATALRSQALHSYIKQQLEYVQFWPLVKFTMSLDHQRENMPPEEVALLHTASDVRSLVGSTMRDADKRLAKVHDRIRKHLEGSSPQLVELVWARLCEELLRWYSRLEQHVDECYPRGAVRLSPSPEQLAELFKAI